MPPPPKRVVLSKKEIGARIRALREQRGISQSKLAQLIETVPQSMWQIETGVRGLSVQQLVMVAHALDASMDDLLGQGQHARTLSPLPRDSRRLLRRMERIQALSPADQDGVLKILDSALKLYARP